MNDKITEAHRDRSAYIYIRQSTAAQVEHNRESTDRQYKLIERARGLGWPNASARRLGLWRHRNWPVGQPADHLVYFPGDHSAAHLAVGAALTWESP